MRTLTLCLLLLPASLAAARPCYTPEQAISHQNKDVCITAHIYDVVELEDGTRFLDVCSPATPDTACRFSIVSPREDRGEVGDLKPYREQDIHIRGTVRPFAGRSEIVLSHVRQFHGGPEKFRPNPSLLPRFSSENGKAPINDPALRAGRRRTTFAARQTSSD